MTQTRATVPVAISRETHDLVRRIAYEQHITMRKVVEKALLEIHGEDEHYEKERRKNVRQKN